MKNLLIVNSSPNGEGSVTRRLAESFSAAWTSAHPDRRVVNRDVGQNPPPHLDQATIGGFYTPAEQRSAEQKQAVFLSDTLIDEVRDADVIVIGAPMHNFGSPSGLKAYFDHICRVGETFQYSEAGPQGMMTGKKAFVLTARGGNYSDGSPAAALDNQEPYIRTVLSFIGITDVTFLHAQGLAMGDETREAAIREVTNSITGAVTELAA